MSPPKCATCGESFRTKAALAAHRCKKKDNTSSDEEEHSSSEEEVRRKRTREVSSDEEERRHHRHKRRGRLENTSSESDSSDDDSNHNYRRRSRSRSPRQSGLIDQQDEIRRLIPRRWLRRKAELERCLADLRETVKDARPPPWVPAQLRAWSQMAIHLHKLNNDSLERNGRPEVAAEFCFLNLMQIYLHSVFGARAEAKFAEELAKSSDPSSTHAIHKAIARAKNVDGGRRAQQGLQGQKKQNTRVPFRGKRNEQRKE